MWIPPDIDMIHGTYVNGQNWPSRSKTQWDVVRLVGEIRILRRALEIGCQCVPGCTVNEAYTWAVEAQEKVEVL